MKIVTIIKKSDKKVLTKFGCDEVTITRHFDRLRLLVPDEVEKKLRRDRYKTHVTKTFVILKDDTVIPKIKKSSIVLGSLDDTFMMGELGLDMSITKIIAVDILVNDEPLKALPFVIK